MDLYIRPTRPVFEKSAAAEVSLPDDANAWPHEIMQELYKQVPYCADFDIDVSMDRVDAERGFGFGHILLASKTEAQSGASPEMMHSIGVNKVRVPVIIKERKLLPFDVIVTEDSKMLPLTEQRLRMALFRPQPFDVTSRTPGDQSMIGQLYPPYRQNSGGFGGGGMAMDAGSMGKQGSAEKTAISRERIVQAVRNTSDPKRLAHAQGTVSRILQKGDYSNPAMGNAGNLGIALAIKKQKNQGLANEMLDSLLDKKASSEKCPKCGSMEKCSCSMGKAAMISKMPTAAMPNALKAVARKAKAVPESFGTVTADHSGMFAGFNKVEKIDPKMTLRGSQRTALPEINYLPKTGSDGAHPLNERIQTVLGLHDVPKKDKKLRLVPATEQHKAASLVPNSTPIRQNSISIKKMMPKLGSVLPAIASSISVNDYTKFASAVADLQEAYAQNGYATVDALQTILNCEPQSVEKRGSALSSVVKPDVVQVKKAARGYTVKTARHNFWDPTTYELDRGQVVKSFGVKVAFEADTTGAVTMAMGEGVHTPEPAVQKSHVVERGGMYKVRTDKGEEVVGYVFPNLTDLDGTVMPMALFTNGTVGALQAEIIGEPVAEAKNPPTGAPVTGEHGLFFRTKADGELEVTVPMKTLGMFQDPDGPKQMVETLEGAQVLVACQPHIQKITMVDNTCVIPGDFKWMPLGHLDEVSLESLPGQGEKQAQANREFASVVIRSGGRDFSFSGFPVEKLAQRDTKFLNTDDALFLLGGLGVDLPHAVEKLGESALGTAPVQVRVGRFLKTAGEATNESRKTASSYLSQMPNLRQDLVKEAAFVPDPMAVDTILSLGFINPENLSTFVTYLPKLDEAQQRMCELLIASRLGLKTLDSGALEKSIKALETTLEGLKVIGFQRN